MRARAARPWRDPASRSPASRCRTPRSPRPCGSAAPGSCGRRLSVRPELARLLPHAPGEDHPHRPDLAARVTGSGCSSRCSTCSAGSAPRAGAPRRRGPALGGPLHPGPAPFLATNLTNERVLLLLTYRETRGTSPGRSALACGAGPADDAADRAPAARPRRRRRLVTELAGGALPPGAARGDARPLGRQPAVRGAAGPGRRRSRARCPATLHELLRARVEHLPGDTRRLLRAAAVIGRVASGPARSRGP